MKTFARASALAILALTAVACSDSVTAPASPEMQAVAGVYGASGEFGALSFTTTTGGESVDWLALGASLSLRLNANGTTAGEILIPGADEDGTDLHADLAGTWELNGDVVTLDHEADTFLRDMPLTVHTDQLTGDRTFSGTRIRLTLRRQ